MRPIARYGFLGSVRKLLSQAAFFIDAKESGMGQTATNLGTAGSVLDAQYGSTTGADTNDPLLLEHDGENYLYLPGVAGNSASTPDAAALDITGDIDIRVRVALDDWTPSAQAGLAMKLTTTGNQRSYGLNVETGGQLSLRWSTDGAVTTSSTSTVATGIADGAVKWVRGTLDVDDGAGNRVVQFFLSDDGLTWTQLGTTVTTAGTTSIFNSTAPLEIGSITSGASFNAAGKFYRAQVLSGIGGTVVFDADFTTGITSGGQTTFTESSSNAATVTINRSTSGRKSVAVVRDVWLFGTDDYLEVADNDLLDFGASDSFTVVAVVRQWATPTNFGRYVDKSSSGDTGWVLSNQSTNLATWAGIDDGPNSASRSALATITAGSTTLVGMIVDRTAQTLASVRNSTVSATTSTSAVGSIANALPMRVGALSSAAAGFQDFECYAVAVFRRALSADELTSIANYYGAS